MENPRPTHGALNRFNRFRSFPRLDTDQTKAAAKPPTPEKTEGVWKVMPSRSSTKTAWDEWSRPTGAVTAALIREGKLERSGPFVAGDSGRESPATLFFKPLPAIRTWFLAWCPPLAPPFRVVAYGILSDGTRGVLRSCRHFARPPCLSSAIPLALGQVGPIIRP